MPDAAQLAAYTKKVLRADARTPTPRGWPRRGAPADSPVPRKVGDPSPIKHVFYVIRENRTYDQVLGDLEKGNGDPNLCLFGEEVTPNAHALAREFVLLDNFYVDAEVSYDGHSFSTGAYATDFVKKVWPMNYGGRGGEVPERGRRRRTGTPTATSPRPRRATSGTPAKRAGVSVRSYGEFAVRYDEGRARTTTRPRHAGAGTVEATVPGPGRPRAARPTRPGTCPIPDNQRVDVWLEEFAEFEASGDLPAPVHPPPRQRPHGGHAARLADADARWSRRTTSRSGRWWRRSRSSRYWKDSAIFVLEDDAQNGPDHVDAHRSVALVDQPLHAPRRGGQHALHDVGHAAHDRADPRPAAHEPVRRGGHADVRRLPGAAGPHAVHEARGARAPRRDERRPRRARRPRWP